MAICDELPGLKISITQNETDMHEHIDSELMEEERTTTRYIEAKSGENFAIRFELPETTKFKGDCLSCEVLIDGTVMANPLLEKQKCRSGYHVHTREGVRLAGGMVKKFRFASLETASDGNLFEGEAVKVKELGSIVVKVSQKWDQGRLTSTKTEQRLESVGIVSEKAVKGRTVSHSVELGQAEMTTKRPGHRHHCELVKGVPSPVATFVFHYRSYQALKSMLIIPRTPSPPPPPALEDKDWDDMTPEEQLKVLSEYRAMKKAETATAVKIKREKEDTNSRPRKAARPKAGDTQLEIGEDGALREGSTATLPEPEVIELD